MNAELSTKINLLKYIKTFSMPDFPDLNIFSKTFFNDLFLKLYKNNNNNNIFTLLYGDIDGLRKLNDTIGYDKADLAVEELLKTVLSYLPEDISSYRVGGDEFCFIIPDLSDVETRKLTKKIHNSLSSNESVKGLDITFAASDSSKFDNIKDMYNFVENKVNLKKHSHLNYNKKIDNIDDYNKQLDELINSTVKSYIENFRFSSNRYFKPDDLKVLSYPIINTVSKLLNDDNSNNHNANENNNLERNMFDEELQIDPTVVSKISNLIMNNKINYEELDSISIEDLKTVKNNLSTDSITDTHNSVYRDHYLIPRFKEDETPFKIILIESLGIKISNSISSHADTDKKIKSTYDCLINELNTIIPKDNGIKLYPIHSGGGTFEIIVQDDNSNVLTSNVVDDVLNKVNSNENNIQLFGAVENCSDASNYNSIYSDLNKECEQKKNTIKEKSDYFISPEALKLLDVSLSSVVNFFKTQSKHLGIYDEHAKIDFSKKVVNSLINNFHDLNLSNELYIEDESDYSR